MPEDFLKLSHTASRHRLLFWWDFFSLPYFGLVSHPALVINHIYLLLSMRKLEARFGVPCVDNMRRFFCCINRLGLPCLYPRNYPQGRQQLPPSFKTGGGGAEVREASVGQGLNPDLNLG